MTKLRPAPRWLTERPIAHRGYHNLDLGRPENSLAAVKAAAEAGFAIECDLQISATGEPVVFHDPDLKRMTGQKGFVRNFSPDELRSYKLHHTDQTIDALQVHLDQVAGRVPFVLELKGVEGKDAGFVEGLAKVLIGYDGLVAVMSFDHWICEQFQRYLPDIPRGLTAQGGEKSGRKHLEAMHAFDLLLAQVLRSSSRCVLPL